METVVNKNMGTIEGTPLSLDDCCRFIDGSMFLFQKEFEEGTENERKFLGKNFSEKDEFDIRNQGRQPLSIPVIKSKLTNISGEQRKRRTSFKIEASVDPNDEIKAELAQLQIKAVERRSKFKYLESDIFDTGIGVKPAVSKMALEMKDYYKRVIVKQIDYRDFIWDRNSKQYDINEDALWCCELEKMPRKFLEEMEGIDTKNISVGQLNNFVGREHIDYYISSAFGTGPEYDMLTLFHFYIKQPRKLWCVVFEDSQNLFGESIILKKYKTKKEAERKLRELQVEYVLRGFAPEGTVEDKTEMRLDYYKFCYNYMIKYEQTDLEMFPYNIFKAIWFGNNHASMMDFLRDPQKIIDRMWMQIDFSIGKSLKNVYLIVKDLLDDNTPEEKARQILNKTGGVIGVKTLREKVIEELTGAGANPQWFTVIELMLGYLEDMAGGVNFQGGAISAQQSGRSQQVLANEGMKLAAPLFDNLARWKESVGINILWWLEHYETAEDVIKVNGGALSPDMIQLLTENGIYTPSPYQKDGTGYVRINQEGNDLSYLSDSNFELTVTEAELSETDKQMRLLQYIEAEKADPMLVQSPTFRKLKLQAMNLKTSEIQMINQEREAIAQQQEALAREQMNMEKAKILISDKGSIEQPKEKKEK